MALLVAPSWAEADAGATTTAIEAGLTQRPCPRGAIRVEPGRAIQPLVERAPAGASFCIASGVHRGQTIAPKDRQTFQGEAGSVLDGSRELSEFDRQGAFWVAAGWRVLPARRGECLPARPACDRPEGVYLDGKALEQVLDRAELGKGRFLVEDGGRRILLADDPAGRMVEASDAQYAFLGNGARDVVVSNLVIQKYASPAQRGTVFDDQDAGASGWRVEHNEIRNNAGLGILAGPRATIRANRVHHNGHLGISVSLEGALVEGNAIVENNIGGFDPEWEGGGVKAALASGAVLRGNHVYRNRGPGLWCDIDCSDILYEDNLVEFNDGAGIFHEISFKATIRGNSLRYNGLRDGGWFWGANILIAGSSDVLVEDNQIEVLDDGAGIALVDQARENEAGGRYRTAGNRVLRNVVRFSGSHARMGGVSDVDPPSPFTNGIAAGNNLFDQNIYLVPPGCSVEFAWDRDVMDFPSFQAIGQDLGSRSLDAGEPVSGVN